MSTKLDNGLCFVGQFLIDIMRNIMMNIMSKLNERIMSIAFSGKISSKSCEIIVLKKQEVINHELTIKLCFIVVR